MPAVVRYEFETLTSYLEQISDFTISPAGKIVGVRVPDSLTVQLGKGARRLHPYGFVFMFPAEGGVDFPSPDTGDEAVSTIPSGGDFL